MGGVNKEKHKEKKKLIYLSNPKTKIVMKTNKKNIIFKNLYTKSTLTLH